MSPLLTRKLLPTLLYLIKEDSENAVYRSKNSSMAKIYFFKPLIILIPVILVRIFISSVCAGITTSIGFSISCHKRFLEIFGISLSMYYESGSLLWGRGSQKVIRDSAMQKSIIGIDRIETALDLGWTVVDADLNRWMVMFIMAEYSR